MNSKKLRITGPDSRPYELGEPMHLYDGETHVGTLDPVPITSDGSEVLIGHFTAANAGSHQKREIGKLAMLEMAVYLAENFTTVQAISFSLNREIEGYGGGMNLASARSQLLHAIGASHIVITPKPDASQMGHFVVTGLWEYNPGNIAVLKEMLEAERVAYAEREALAERDKPKNLSWVQRLFKTGRN